MTNDIRNDQTQQPMRLNDVELAIVDWITRVAAVVPSVIWERQNVPQPPYPYCSLLWTSNAKEGGRDERRTSTDLTRPDGEEIESMTTGPRKLSLSASFHVDAASGGNDPRSYAYLLAERARSSLGREGVLDHLRNVGNLAVVREHGVTDTSVVVNGEWINRATFDVDLRATSIVTERVGYIEKAEVSVPSPGIDFTIDASS